MQNYYVLENHVKWSGTNCVTDIACIGSSGSYQLNEMNVNIIINYMKNIKEELLKYNTNSYHIEEINLNCDTVILFAKVISESKKNGCLKNDSLKAQLEELKLHFVKLWNIKNQDCGYNIFTGCLDSIINKFD